MIDVRQNNAELIDRVPENYVPTITAEEGEFLESLDQAETAQDNAAPENILETIESEFPQEEQPRKFK